MEVETGSLTAVLERVLALFRLGRADIVSDAWSLLGLLGVIELTLLSLFWALTGENVLVGLIKKILAIGFFVFLVQNYDSFIKTVIDGFIYTGKRAAAAGGASSIKLEDPSAILHVGLTQVFPIMDHIRSYSGFTSVLSNIPDILISAICAFGVMIAYFIIAAQAFITYIEFGLVSTLGVILLPFGVFKHTAFLSEKLFGAIIAFGVKLMTLSLIVSITMPLVKDFILPPDPSWDKLFQLLFVTLSVALLSWHAPSVASSLLSGHPTLTAGTAFSTSAAATGAAAGAGVLASRTPVYGRAPLQASGAAARAAGGVLHAGAGLAGTFAGGAAAAASAPGPVSRSTKLLGGTRTVVSQGVDRATSAPRRSISNVKTVYDAARERAVTRGIRSYSPPLSGKAVDLNRVPAIDSGGDLDMGIPSRPQKGQNSAATDAATKDNEPLRQGNE